MSAKDRNEQELTLDDIVSEDVGTDDASGEYGGSTAWLSCATDWCNKTTLSCHYDQKIK